MLIVLLVVVGGNMLLRCVCVGLLFGVLFGFVFGVCCVLNLVCVCLCVGFLLSGSLFRCYVSGLWFWWRVWFRCYGFVSGLCLWLLL